MTLLQHLEAAGEGSRELDGLIYAVEKSLVRNGCTFIMDINGSETFQFQHPTKMHPNGPAALYVRGYDVPAYTDSLDAALALAERVLPGWRMHALQDQDGIYQADNTATRWFCGVSEKRGPGNVMSKAPTPALALCAAILRARSAGEGGT